MCRYFLLFLYFVAFLGLCHTESDIITYNMNFTAQEFGSSSYGMRGKNAIRAFNNKSLEIIVGHMVGQQKFGKIDCHDMRKNSIKPINGTMHDNDFYIIQVPIVTAEMSTKWNCAIEETVWGQSNLYYLTLNVHVIAAERPSLTIGSDELKLTVANNTSTQYDAIAHYSYEDGQSIQLICQSPNRNVALEYRDVKGTKHTPGTSGNATFEKLLLIENNGAEVDCIISTAYTDYIYRIKLQLNGTENFAGLTGENTLITISLVVLVILALLITGVFLIWRQRTNKESQSDGDYVDLVSDSATTTRRNTKTSDILHEIHNNDLYAISMKKLAQRENTYEHEDPVYSVPR